MRFWPWQLFLLKLAAPLELPYSSGFLPVKYGSFRARWVVETMTLNTLKDELGQLLLPLSHETRQSLEKKCLESHPLQLLAVLSDARPTTPAVRQLAGVLLAKQIPSFWSEANSMGALQDEKAKLQTGLISLLLALDSMDPYEWDPGAIRSLVDCTACVANCLAVNGVVWQDLFLWMREIASDTRMTQGSNMSDGLAGSSTRRRRAFLYLLDRLLESAAWQDLLEPHVMEVSELLCRIAMLAPVRGAADALQPLGEDFACSKHALESLGSLAVVVRGEDAARIFHHQVVKLLLSPSVVGSELCESALEALSRAAAADELLIADPSFYHLGLAPEELCPVVQLGLTAAVSQRGERRLLALRVLYSVAESHSRLLCTSQKAGQLSADEVLQTLVEHVAPDEVRARSSTDSNPFPAEATSAAEWGAEYALLVRISKRLPDKLVLPSIYRIACQSLAGSDVSVKLAAFASLRAILVGCMSSVKKQLQRIARLVLRALTDSQLHSVTFVLIADLCGLVPVETRCGSCRLAERLLPPLLQQLQLLQLRDRAFPSALKALEAAGSPQSGLSKARLPAFRAQSSVVAITWTAQKLEELLCSGETLQTSPDIWDGIATRLCTLLAALVHRQPPAKRNGDKSLKALGAKMAVILHRILLSGCSLECRSMALEASGAWMKLCQSDIVCSDGLKCRELQELFSISLRAAERGLQDGDTVTADAALRFVMSLGAPSPGAAFTAGLEQCARNPTAALLQAGIPSSSHIQENAYTYGNNVSKIFNCLLLLDCPGSSIIVSLYPMPWAQADTKVCIVRLISRWGQVRLTHGKAMLTAWRWILTTMVPIDCLSSGLPANATEWSRASSCAVCAAGGGDSDDNISGIYYAYTINMWRV